jgi:hypothetical protein
MGITTNALDYSFNANDQFPRILSEFATLCIEAAKISPSACPLAYFASMNASEASLESRITDIISSLAKSSYFVPAMNTTVSFDDLAGEIRSSLLSPDSFASLSQFLLDVEGAIQNGVIGDASRNTVSFVPSSLLQQGSSLSTFDASNPLTGIYNTFAYYAVSCLDVSMAGVDDPLTFAQKVTDQLSADPLVGYMSFSFAPCLGWPNLSSFDVERFTQPFPSKLRNKILIIGVTNDPVTPYHGSLATYQYIGASNANFLIHDAFGQCTISSPNNCSTSAIQKFLLNGSEIN